MNWKQFGQKELEEMTFIVTEICQYDYHQCKSTNVIYNYWQIKELINIIAMYLHFL